MEYWQLYGVGYGLGLIGSLAVVVSQLLAGHSGVVGLGATFVFGLGLVSVFKRDELDRERSLVYRIGNWSGSVFVVVLGLAMLAFGVFSLNTFA